MRGNLFAHWWFPLNSVGYISIGEDSDAGEVLFKLNEGPSL